MRLFLRVIITILLLASIGLLSAVASNATGTTHIDQPFANAVLTGVVQVRGTAVLINPTPTDLRYYRLEYSRVDETSRTFTLIGESVRDVAVRDGLLDVWDTTQVPNGTYVIRLQVFGRGSTPARETSLPVIVANDLPSLQRHGQEAAYLSIDAAERAGTAAP